MRVRSLIRARVIIRVSSVSAACQPTNVCAESCTASSGGVKRTNGSAMTLQIRHSRSTLEGDSVNKRLAGLVLEGNESVVGERFNVSEGLALAYPASSPCI